MKSLAVLLSSCLLVLLLSSCGGTPAIPTDAPPTPAPPTPTSYVGHAENASMLCGAFRLTVTEVRHLSNAVLLRVQVENSSDQEATWSPSAQAYMLDGDQQLQPNESYGVMEYETTLAPGVVDQGELIVPLPQGETFRLYYPQCEPAYVTLRKP